MELPYALKVSLASPRPSPTLHRPVQMVENIDVEVVNVKAASKKASEGKHVISLSDLDPDVDGDGVRPLPPTGFLLVIYVTVNTAPGAANLQPEAPLLTPGVLKSPG